MMYRGSILSIRLSDFHYGLLAPWDKHSLSETGCRLSPVPDSAVFHAEIACPSAASTAVPTRSLANDTYTVPAGMWSPLARNFGEHVRAKIEMVRLAVAVGKWQAVSLMMPWKL
jgi:hypothetical protein